MTIESVKCSRLRLAACFFAWMALLLPSALVAQSDASRHDLFEVESATALDREGVPPWHLQMSFDLSGLNGKEKESGTIEEWWIGQGRKRIVVSSPSFSIPSMSPKGEDPWVGREAYLVKLLLQQVVHPVQDYSRFQGLRFETKPRAFGKVTLSCISVRSKGMFDSFGWPEYCSEPNTSTLRIHFDAGELSVARNRLGTFMNTSVSLRNTISYGGKMAIAGEVTKLERYVPGKDEIAADDSANGGQEVPGSVVAGDRVKFVQPEYPEMERARHAGGSVVLCAVISREGKITSLDVVASPAEDFSKSAMEAVRKWEYQPYLLNGKPTELDTTITINFSTNR